MCASGILQFLYNLLWGSPPPEPKPSQQPEEQENLQYPPQPAPELGVLEDPVPLEYRVLGCNPMSGSLYGESGLRFRARDERAQMISAFKEGRQATSKSDKAAAIKRAHMHRRSMEDLNRQASEEIFNENNKRNRRGIIDLHDLYVDEAILYTDCAIEEAVGRGETELRLIVGIGRHSEGGMPKLKPAIEKHLQGRKLVANPDPKNAGMLIVRLKAEQTGSASLENPKQ